MIRPSIAAVLPAGLLLFSGCAHPKALPRLPEPPAEIPGYVALLGARSSGTEGTSRARVAAAFLAPSSLRLEILDPAGSTRAVLISSEEGALYLDPAARSYRTFPDGAGALDALVGIEAPSDLLARLVLGPAAAMQGLVCAGEAPTTCKLPGGGELHLLHASPSSAEIVDPRTGTVEVRWDRSVAASGEIPRATELRLPARGAMLRLEMRELRFTAPETSLFSLLPPVGFHPAEPSGR
ncbi:MAG TPA: hypothetical protein VFW45_04075 [Candidatus Polarisedimenticolia bacterium]|nr:hypothetical protein [Candidatus Polarisedimenticolia bacterium]